MCDPGFDICISLFSIDRVDIDDARAPATVADEEGGVGLVVPPPLPTFPATPGLEDDEDNDALVDDGSAR